MNKATWAMLNETEKELLRQAEGSSLATLDEDDLLDLHTRVRRARNKYATLYRRRASAQVREDAGRTKAHAQHARTAAKAEAFEEVLARVSFALAKAARASAAELRVERLEAAQRPPRSRPRPSSGSTRGTRAKPSSGTREGTQRRTPIRKRASASARATTRRAEATRDSR